MIVFSNKSYKYGMFCFEQKFYVLYEAIFTGAKIDNK